MSVGRRHLWTIVSEWSLIWLFCAAVEARAADSASAIFTMAASDTTAASTTVAPDSVLAIETPSQIMALPLELKSRLHSAVRATQGSERERLERLIQFIFEPQGLGMRYREDATHTVARSYASREANCVGFTLLFLALAREVGLEATPQGIHQTLTWRQDDRTVYRSNHVNVRVRLGGRMHTVDFAIEPVIARNLPSPISDDRLLSMYYNNLAMAAMMQQRMDEANILMTASLRLDSTYAPHWSNAGVLSLRNGDIAAAERAYAAALKLDASEPSALFNLASLARRAGDAVREANYRNRLANVQRNDPFHYFLQAIALEQDGDYQGAIRHYRRAIRLFGKEHRFYAALAHAYARAGDTGRAIKALTRAKALSDGSARDAYQSQLNDLTATAL